MARIRKNEKKYRRNRTNALNRRKPSEISNKIIIKFPKKNHYISKIFRNIEYLNIKI